MNFHCPMCHVVCQIIIFWRFPSTERVFLLFVHALTLMDGGTILHPNTNKPSNIANPSNTPPKKHQTKKPNTHAHSVFWGEVREKGWGEKEVMNPNLYYGLGGGCADAKVLWAWLLSLHDGTVLVFPEDLQHEAAGIARFVFFVFCFFWIIQ